MSCADRNLRQYISSDYAGINIPSKRIVLYYGYEVTDAEENWCFKATFPDGDVTIAFPALLLADISLDQFEVTGCLLTGITILIERGDLKA